MQVHCVYEQMFNVEHIMGWNISRLSGCSCHCPNYKIASMLSPNNGSLNPWTFATALSICLTSTA